MAATNYQDSDSFSTTSFRDKMGLLTNHPFDLAYQAAEDFTALLRQRKKGAGFMRTLLLQRICSSFASGRSTATKLLHGDQLEDDDEALLFGEPPGDLTPPEAAHLRSIVEE